MEDYRRELKQKFKKLHLEYNILIAKLEKKPTAELFKECNSKWIQIITVKSRIDNINKPRELVETYHINNLN